MRVVELGNTKTEPKKIIDTLKQIVNNLKENMEN